MSIYKTEEFTLILILAKYENDSMVNALVDYFMNGLEFKKCLTKYNLNNSNFRKKIEKVRRITQVVDQIVVIRNV